MSEAALDTPGSKPADAVLAAELALGVLDASEQARAEARAAEDDAFAAAAAAWAARLHPLVETVPAVAPAPDLWDRVSRHAAPREVVNPAPLLPTEPGIVAPSQAPPPRPPAVARWRAAAFGAMALAAASLVTAGVQATRKAATWTPLLTARLAAAAGEAELLPTGPLFVATVDRARGTAVVTPTSPGPVDPRTRELWLQPKGGAAIAVGPVSGADPRPLHLPPATLKAAQAGATLSVSLEPVGVKPGPHPTGAVIAAGVLKPS